MFRSFVPLCKQVSKLSPLIKCFFDECTFTAQYVISCPESKISAIIDPVLEYDVHSGSTNTTQADEILQYVNDNKLKVDYILETHIHADHITSSYYLKNKLNELQASYPKTCISNHVTQVQNIFSKKYKLDIPCDGSQFDVLLQDNDILSLGNLNIKVLQTPGHTPACISYLLDNHCVFVGDTLFMPDSGTARCDFPGGSASELWNSLQKLLSLPSHTDVYICHDYKANGNRDHFTWKSTIEEEKNNIQLVNKDEKQYIEFRKTRDNQLKAPKLIHPSLQFNLTAGIPPKSGFIKTPITTSWLTKQ